ncbi:MAG: ATP-binding protein [Spirochaetales bacterium]|jgi:predicted AAA+ superfamily ATPase|nr:ATP-binding protein [Spirochaetales bacterium]
MKYFHRQIEEVILQASNEFPVVVLTGSRQTGKTTLLKHLFANLTYITLDDPVRRQIVKQDPGLFISSIKRPCIIDEVQYAPELFPYIKMIVDDNRDQMGTFILTGSQIFPLMKGLSESLAGRAAVFQLLGFSQKEFPLPAHTQNELFKRILTGSFPDPLIHNRNIRFFYGSYINTYLEKDLRQLSNIQDLSQFQAFVEILAGRVGNLFNISEICNSLGVSQTTAKRWMSILEQSGIIYLLKPYFKNIKKRIIKRPKLYFTDTGLAASLLRYPNSDVLSISQHNGALFENWVVTEILKCKYNHLRAFDLFFFRDSHHKEIDLVLEYGNRQKLIEIKLAQSLKSTHYKTLDSTKTLFSNPELFIVSFYPDSIPITNDITNIPWWEISRIL